MSTYSPFKDTPFTINDEGNRISIEFKPGSDSTATITWGIPANIDNPNLPPNTYDGLVVLIDTKPIEAKPTNGQFYTSDNTADELKHVGDRIGECLVVGAFYNDKTTTSLTLTDILPKTNYYVAAFAVDNVRVYHDGIFSYELPLTLKNDTKSTKGYQTVKLGVLPTDTLSVNHDFRLYIDSTPYNFNVTASTYAELVNEINRGIVQIDNVYFGSDPLNTNGLSLRNNILYQFDGLNENQIEYYPGATSPENMPTGTYRYNGTALYQWNNGWVDQNAISYHKPLTGLDCSDFWFNGATAYQFNTSWKKKKTYIGTTDPAACPVLNCNSIWFDGSTYFKYVGGSLKWAKLPVYASIEDPLSYYNGYYWLNNGSVYQLNNQVWELTTIVVGTQPTVSVATDWYNATDNKVYRYNSTTKAWDILPIDIINVAFDVTIPGDWYWNDIDNDILLCWDESTNNWLETPVITGSNPVVNTVKTGDCWYNNGLHQWDGSQWVDVNCISSNIDPRPANGLVWYDTINNNFNRYDGLWTIVQGCSLSYDPTNPQVGQYWYNTVTRSLFQWNGANWQSVMYSTSSLKPKVNDLWFNTLDNKLYKFTKQWDTTDARATCELINGDITITSNTLGSSSNIVIPELSNDIDHNLFFYTSPRGEIQNAVIGTDEVPQQPMYQQLGVGTDGSVAERRDMTNQILMCLGYPSVQVELDRAQIELCIDLALKMFRKLSVSAYERAVFFLDFEPNKQHYFLTDKKVGLHRVVDVQGVYRRNSSFMGSTSGNGIYAQQFLQWMYNPSMGMDLISYHIIAEYTELMEILFATRIVHRFNERTRRLDIYQNIGLIEKVLVDCTIERTEQELMLDRVCGKWILTWALGEAYMMLANIRGKYSSLPGAGGSVSLNASDMQTHADNCFEKCRDEIDNYIANEPENIGLESTLIWG